MSSFNGENYCYMPYYHPHKTDYYDGPMYHHAPTFSSEPVVPVLAYPIVPSHIDMYPTSLSPPSMTTIPSNPALPISSHPVLTPSSPLPPPSSTVPTPTYSFSSSPSSQSSSLVPSPVNSSATLPSCPSLTEKINQRLARANPFPDSFLPEFHQYSKETYETGSCRKKRNRKRDSCQRQNFTSSASSSSFSSFLSDNEDDGDDMSATELRRQVHIQSEQKRRAQIRDGFDVLRQHLPGINHKKVSKATLLRKTVQHLAYMKKQQGSLLVELEKLVQENEYLRRQQQHTLV